MDIFHNINKKIEVQNAIDDLYQRDGRYVHTRFENIKIHFIFTNKPLGQITLLVLKILDLLK